jgi:Phage tail protein (Tail_P2_I)
MAHLLPRNSTALEVAFSEAADRFTPTDPTIDTMHGFKLPGRIPAQFADAMIYEFGLGEISEFFSSWEDLINQGLAWQRVRGTHHAVDRALNWIAYNGTIEHFPTRRKRWNLWMEKMSALPVQERPDLFNIETLCNLSAPARSYFWRGFREYDVRALDWSRTRWSDTRYSSYSGVRLDGKAKWSFGRTYEYAVPMMQSDLQALGVWIAPVGTPITWKDANTTWKASNVSWRDASDATRIRTMISSLLTKSIYVVFKDQNGVIGIRRPKVACGVRLLPNGQYTVNGNRYRQTEVDEEFLYIEALTDFADGFGSTATQIKVCFDGDLDNDVPDGTLWLAADELDGGLNVDVASSQSITFREAVRERVKILFSF